LKAVALLARRGLYVYRSRAGKLVLDEFERDAVTNGEGVEACKRHVTPMKKQLTMVSCADEAVAVP
jgi:hypothetical protein